MGSCRDQDRVFRGDIKVADRKAVVLGIVLDTGRTVQYNMLEILDIYLMHLQTYIDNSQLAMRR